MRYPFSVILEKALLLLYEFMRLAVKQQFQRMACFDPLLATSSQKAADSTEYFGPLNGSKTAGYFLLNL